MTRSPVFVSFFAPAWFHRVRSSLTRIPICSTSDWLTARRCDGLSLRFLMDGVGWSSSDVRGSVDTSPFGSVGMAQVRKEVMATTITREDGTRCIFS